MRVGLFLALCLVCSVRQPEFLSWNNLVNNVLVNAAPYGIMACGMTLVMIGGGFDLSIGSMAAVCSVVAGAVCVRAAPTGPAAALVLAVLAALLAGTVLGSVNGAFISYLRINPFVVTLSFMLIYRSLALVLSGGGKPITIHNDAFQALNWGSVNLLGRVSRGGVPVPILVLIGIVAPTILALRLTRFGRHLYALGGNEEVSWLSGVNTARLKFATYCLMGTAAALGSVIVTAKTVIGDASGFRGDEMQVIAAVIIGGTPLGGGSGSASGTVLGLLVLVVIQNLLTLAGVGSDYRDMVNGAIILIVVAAEAIAKRR